MVPPEVTDAQLGALAQIFTDILGESKIPVLDLAATPLIARRCAQAATLAERLQILMTLGDDHKLSWTRPSAWRSPARSSTTPRKAGP